MTLRKIVFNPGVNREATNYTNESKYWDCDKIRFRSGYPEKIGGWQRAFPAQPVGSPRSLFNWLTIDGAEFLAIATEAKLYLERGTALYNITPLRREVLADDPFETFFGSESITIHDIGSNPVYGEWITISGVTSDVNGIPASEVNGDHQISYVVDSDTYGIDLTTLATSSGTPSIPDVTIEYEIPVGLNVSVPGTGWGAGAWSRGAWGSAANSVGITQLRLWSLSNYGSDLVAGIRDGDLYYWTYSAIAEPARAVLFSSLPGGIDIPTTAAEVQVTEDRHVVAYSTNTLGTTTLDRLLVRWASQENPIEWLPAATNTAGDYRLTDGSYIIATEKVRQEVLIWTDSALYSQQFIGPPYTFSFEVRATNISCVSPMCTATANNTTYWMGRDKFYTYNGQVSTLNCTIRTYVFGDFNVEQGFQTFGATNEKFNEVWWFYCSAGQMSPNRYVIYNYLEDTWAFGDLNRTAWIDSKLRHYPLAAAPTGIVYHELGVDDEEVTGEPVPLAAFVQTADFDIDDGDSVAFVKRMLPDVTFVGSTATSPSVTLQMQARNFTGQQYYTTRNVPTTRTVAVPVELFTEQLWIRLRGRHMNLRLESSALGVQWQLGAPRIDVQRDGRR